MAATDVQRQKVYESEWAAFGKPIRHDGPLPDGAYVAKARRCLTEREAQKIVDRNVAWLRSKGYRLRAGKTGVPVVEVTNRGRNATAQMRTGRLRLQVEWPHHVVLLHEIAHFVTAVPGWERDGHDGAAHGREFCAAFLALVQHDLGVEAAKRLRQEMKVRRCRYTAKRTRQISDADRAALAERLAANRRPPSPHRYAFVRKPHDLGPVEAVVIALPRGRASRRRLDTPHDGPVYASTRQHDYVIYHAAAELFNRQSRNGTIDPARALTRTTVESLERWAENDPWFDRPGWVIEDIAAAVAPAEAAAKAEKAAAVERENRRNRIRQLRHDIAGILHEVEDEATLDAAFTLLDASLAAAPTAATPTETR